MVQFAGTQETSLPGTKVVWYLCGELEKAVGLEGVDAISAVGKGGRDGHGCCRLGMWKEYAG